jgi:hypothetical protein
VKALRGVSFATIINQPITLDFAGEMEENDAFLTDKESE